MDSKIEDLECVKLSQALMMACKSNNVEIVKTLLKDPAIDVSEESSEMTLMTPFWVNSEMLEAATELKTSKILSLLLSEKSRIDPQVINDGLRHAIWIAKNPIAVEEFIKHDIHPKDIWGTTIYHGIPVDSLPSSDVMTALLKSNEIKIESSMVTKMLTENRDVAELMTQHKSFIGDKLALLGHGG